jgi:DNA repair photolyase
MLQYKQVKSVLNKHKKRDSWFLDEYSVNPYEGCSCNCIYCYIRGSKYSENLSDGLAVKANMLQLLEKQLILRSRRNEYGIVAIGTATDAYMHQEEELKMTRQVLELLLKYRFPVFISTKRNLITRDLDILKEIDKAAILPIDLKDKLQHGVILSVSISTLDERISAILEPGAIPPLERLYLVSQLKEQRFLTGVNAMPLLPFISDTEEALTELINAAKKHNSDYLLAAGLTLFGNDKADSKTLYFKFIERYKAPLLKQYQELYEIYPYKHFFYQKQLSERIHRLCRQYEISNSILK